MTVIHGWTAAILPFDYRTLKMNYYVNHHKLLVKSIMHSKNDFIYFPSHLISDVGENGIKRVI